MPHQNRGPALLAATLAAFAVAVTAAAACADQTSPVSGAGLVVVRSTAGNVTVVVGNAGEVRIVAPAHIAMTHFTVSADADGHIMLPQQGQGQGQGQTLGPGQAPPTPAPQRVATTARRRATAAERRA